ncbi:MAG TPA: peptidyl-prolyl cis-trans isomerase [Rhizomicrobium sp.]|nr:peptidyl-prolyl cis-trans isomerase [Rhizomicrobium sp.]
MHQLSRSWLASLLMGGLALSFVVWGIADVFTGGGASSLATVGSTEIGEPQFSRFYRNFLRNVGQQEHQDITPDMAQRMGLPAAALQQMLSSVALGNEADRLGLTAPDRAVADNIQSIPAFRSVAGFDRQTFLRIIDNAGYSEQDFFEEVRSDLTRDQLTSAVQSNFVIPAGYAQALFLFLNERRAADYVIVSPDSLGPIPPPDDATLAAYIKANPTRFSTPEYRDVDYAEIGPEDIANQSQVTDKQVQQEFEARKAQYVTPEKRDVQQLPFPNQADAAAAKAKFAAGTSFDSLIQARGFKSADITSTGAAKSDLPAGVADAAFALPLNGVSDPVKSSFGYVLLHVTKIEPGNNKNFADVKDDIRKALATQIAAGKLADIANAFEDARSGGASVAQAAKKTGMKYGHVAAIDASGKTPDGSPAAAPQDPEFLSAVVNAEDGEDNDPFQAKNGYYYVVKVNGHTPPKLENLDQVRPEATAGWTAEQRAKLLAQKAKQLTAEAQKQNSLDGIARELKATVQHSPALTRNTADATFSADLVQQLFETKSGGIVSGSQEPSGSYIVARLTGVSHPEILPGSPGFSEGVEQLSQNTASDFSAALANAAREKQGVRVNQKMLQSAIGGGS